MAYWVELSLLHSGDESTIDKLVDCIAEAHRGQVTFSAAGPELFLALVDQSSEPVEQVICRIVGLVRATAHELGFSTLGWPEPVRIGDVSAKPIDMEVSA